MTGRSVALALATLLAALTSCLGRAAAGTEYLECERSGLQFDSPLSATVLYSGDTGICIFDVTMPQDASIDRPEKWSAIYLRDAYGSEGEQRLDYLEKATDQIYQSLINLLDRPNLKERISSNTREQILSISSLIPKCSASAYSGTPYQETVAPEVSLSCLVNLERERYEIVLSSDNVRIEFSINLA